jgi:hypothetical protein
VSTKTGEGFAVACVVGLCMAVILWAASASPGAGGDAHAFREGAKVGAYLALAAFAILLAVPVRGRGR